jgi:hypothetical protein
VRVGRIWKTNSRLRDGDRIGSEHRQLIFFVPQQNDSRGNALKRSSPRERRGVRARRVGTAFLRTVAALRRPSTTAEQFNPRAIWRPPQKSAGARDCVPQRFPTSSHVRQPESAPPAQAAAGRRPALRRSPNLAERSVRQSRRDFFPSAAFCGCPRCQPCRFH